MIYKTKKSGRADFRAMKPNFAVRAVARFEVGVYYFSKHFYIFRKIGSILLQIYG